MKRMALVSAIAMFATGCATVVDGSHQDFTVATYGDKAPEETRCLVKNEEGEWQVLANTVTPLRRDGNVMEIECKNSFQSGTASVNPRFQAEFLILDIIWDACILTASCIIDGATNAFFEYPDSVSVEMKDTVTPPEVAVEP